METQARHIASMRIKPSVVRSSWLWPFGYHSLISSSFGQFIQRRSCSCLELLCWLHFSIPEVVTWFCSVTNDAGHVKMFNVTSRSFKVHQQKTSQLWIKGFHELSRAHMLFALQEVVWFSHIWWNLWDGTALWAVMTHAALKFVFSKTRPLTWNSDRFFSSLPDLHMWLRCCLFPLPGSIISGREKTCLQQCTHPVQSKQHIWRDSHFKLCFQQLHSRLKFPVNIVSDFSHRRAPECDFLPQADGDTWQKPQISS